MSDHIILVGKPTPQTLEPMGVKLQDLGYTLHVVSNAVQAMSLARSAQPVAILIDVATPELNGIEICQTIKKELNGTASIPIVALNDKQIALRKAALSAGADTVMDYPVNWVDLQMWLSGPRDANGKPLAVGALLGRTEEDTLGSAALLSHDLKSPISLVISSLEVLINLYEDERAQDSTIRLLRGALHAAYRQMNMVTELIDLARLELHNYDLQRSDVDVAQLIRDRLTIDAYSISVKGLRLETDLEPLMVHGDRDLLNRLISALIENAMKFTVRDDLLRITVHREGSLGIVTFTDSGRMIQEGFEQDMMKRAPQWEKRQSGNRTSVGMSLPFIYQVARVHDGDFKATSDETSRLTSFILSLPALPD